MNAMTAPAIMDDNPRREIIFGLFIVTLFFGGLGLWGATARLDAAAMAQGVVVVSSNRQAVQHRDGGTLVSLLAKDGDRVEAGTVIAALDDNELRASANSLSAQWIELTALAARLDAERRGTSKITTPEAFADLDPSLSQVAEDALSRQRQELNARSQSVSAQLTVLNQQIREMEARKRGLQDRISSIDEQADILNDELVGMRHLADQGLAPLTRVRALERSLAELGGERAELKASISQVEENISGTRSESVALERGETRDVTRELRETEGKIADLWPRLLAVRAQLERTEVRAPASGIVVGSTVFTVGGVIAPGQTVMEIVPEGEPLIVDARIRPEDVDDVTVGMKAEVKFSGLQGRSLPIIYGVVDSISGDRLIDEQTGTPYFRIKVTVSDEEIDRLMEAGADFVLKPGLPTSVAIPLRKRTALQYIVEPLTASLWKSFREN
ncbi:MAG: secretion protein HylD [Hirschia sp.]|nr:secretion protein HylD [Hirschia sp.]MBF18176.1 secretion protein HylD [Hirschia sp.]